MFTRRSTCRAYHQEKNQTTGFIRILFNNENYRIIGSFSCFMTSNYQESIERIIKKRADKWFVSDL